VELLVSLLHSSSHAHRRQQQEGNTKSFDTDDADTGDVEQMSVLQRKVLYALSSALRGNVDVQVCILSHQVAFTVYCVLINVQSITDKPSLNQSFYLLHQCIE